MKDCRIAAVQMNAPLGKIEDNLSSIETWARKAQEQDVDLVVFPELSITGHWCSEDSWKASQPLPDGDASMRIADLAQELDIYISVGIGEREKGVQYNTQALFGPQGYLGKQRKLHMSRDEYFYYRTGTKMPVLETEKCRLGTVICYDNVFPEVPRILAIKGAEVILAPHASRFGRWDQMKPQQRVADQKAYFRKAYTSRALDNGVFYVVVNQAGKAGKDTNHAGGIMIIDPQGEVIEESKTDKIEPEMVTVELKASVFEKRRCSRCFNLSIRRPEIYGWLTKSTD